MGELRNLAQNGCSLKVSFLCPPSARRVTTITNCAKPRNFFPQQVELGDGQKEVQVHSDWKPPELPASSLHLVGPGSLLGGKMKTMGWAGPGGEGLAKTFKTEDLIINNVSI